MKFKAKKLERLMNQIDAILKTADELEAKYESDIALVHPAYKKSAANLIHYMALRSYDLSGLQQELRTMGLPGLDNVEAHAMRSLLALKTILNHLLGEPKYEHRKGAISVNKSKKILNANTRALFGYKSKIDSGNLGEIEEDILKANKVELEDFRIPELTYLSLKGDYRTALVEVKNLDIEIKDDEVYEGTKKIIVKFDLPSGVYATTFLGNFFDLAEERSF